MQIPTVVITPRGRVLLIPNYKAPHANKPTPTRRHYPRSTRPFKLFKGHRP